MLTAVRFTLEELGACIRVSSVEVRVPSVRVQILPGPRTGAGATRRRGDGRAHGCRWRAVCSRDEAVAASLVSVGERTDEFFLPLV